MKATKASQTRKAKKEPNALAPAHATATRNLEQHEILLRPSVQNARVLGAWARLGEVDVSTVAHALRESASKVIEGDTALVKALLYDQAVALQAIFTNLSIEASKSDTISRMEPLLRMALKAQSQSRASLETLAAVMSPPVVFARQANIASGPQQVNNGVPVPSPAPASLVCFPPTELLKDEPNGICMDSRSEGATGRVDSNLAPLGALDGAAHRAGQGAKQEQQVSRGPAPSAPRGAPSASSGAERTTRRYGPRQVSGPGGKPRP